MAGYRIELEPDDNGTFLVTCPALPEVNSFGDNEVEAHVFGAQAIEEALAARISAGQDVPSYDEEGEGFVRLSLLTTLKVGLYNELRAQGLTRADLMRRMQANRETVDRLFRLDHASRTDQIEAAMAALGRAVNVSIDRAA